ncbi:MAG: rhodanese-like domain-containing protein [Flavobacteriia bacterium]|nr:rhodanese-like domain-containing protein [Flavobacteriia bacterium]
MLNRIAVILMILFVSFSCNAQGKGVKLIKNTELKEVLQKNNNIQLIDVRTENEFNSGTIKGAKNINYFSKDFKQEISKLDKNKAIYIFCQVGGRSAKAAKIVSELGFKEVYDLKDGYSEWNK